MCGALVLRRAGFVYQARRGDGRRSLVFGFLRVVAFLEVKGRMEVGVSGRRLGTLLLQDWHG